MMTEFLISEVNYSLTYFKIKCIIVMKAEISAAIIHVESMA